MIKPSDMDLEERKMLVEEVGRVLNDSHKLAFQSHTYFTLEETALFEAANMIMGIAYTKAAKRLKVKVK